jgi:hypothetical protein
VCGWLQHYLYPTGGEGLHLVVDDKGRFRDDSFQQAMSQLQASPLDDDAIKGKGGGGKPGDGHVDLGKGKGGGKKGGKPDKKTSGQELFRIIKLCMDRGWDPVRRWIGDSRRRSGIGTRNAAVTFPRHQALREPRLGPRVSLDRRRSEKIGDRNRI